MTDTTVAEGLKVQKWDKDFFMEYIRENPLSKYMGKSQNSIVQLKSDLTKKRGESSTFSLVNRLTGAGVTGSATLEGNEEALVSRSFKVAVDKIRNAVRVAEIDEQYSAIELRDAGKTALQDWITEQTRDDVLTALGSINGTALSAATETAKDAWVVDNGDRVFFGPGLAEGAVTDHSVGLSVITSSNKLEKDLIGKIKRAAKNASPKIRPIKVNGGQEWYLLLCDSYQFRDLKASLETIHADSHVRGKGNPIYTDGDICYDGIMIHEVPELGAIYRTELAGAGASSADLGAAFLLGAQAVGISWAKKTTSKTEEFDYGDKVGVAVEEIRGIKKMLFGSGSSDTADLKDHGVVTIYTASAED